MYNNKEDLYYLCLKAKEEWQTAANCFEWATEPELIDYAIYWMLKTQRYYCYLLKLARQKEYTTVMKNVYKYSLYK